jgi:acyl-CoA thioesterase-2
MDLAEAAGPVSRIWLRARGVVPADPVVNGCVLTYLTALTLLEPALGPMGKSPTDVSALLDHTVWFHGPADFSDWLFFERNSPSGIDSRALATGTVFNRSGFQVCTARQEGYFPAARNS